MVKRRRIISAVFILYTTYKSTHYSQHCTMYGVDYSIYLPEIQCINKLTNGWNKLLLAVAPEHLYNKKAF